MVSDIFIFQDLAPPLDSAGIDQNANTVESEDHTIPNVSYTITFWFQFKINSNELHLKQPTNLLVCNIHYFQEGMSATSEYDPENLSHMTLISNPKNVESMVDWDGLSQLTPLNNILIAAEPSNTSILVETTPYTPRPTFVPQPRYHDEMPPAKHSSSKRVKLIKQEKK